MQIKNYLSLFWCSHIRYKDYVPDGMTVDSPAYESFDSERDCEEVADTVLDNWRYWLNVNQQIYLYQWPAGRSISIHPIQPEGTFWMKIYLTGIRVLLTVPAVIIKAYLWIFSSNIRQRNRIVLDLLKKQENFKRKCDPKSYSLQSKKLSSINSQYNNRLLSLPKVIQMSFLVFLNRKSIVSFAMTCGKNYEAASEFSNQPLTLKRDCPNFMVQSLGHERIAQLPIAGLPGDWNFLFDIFQHQKKMTSTNEANKSLCHFRVWAPSHHSLSSLMQHHSIQRILMPEGIGFIIRIIDHGQLSRESTFVIAKVNDEWKILSSNLSPGLWLFLRDLSYHQEVPLVIDYLKRLFDGKPCGNFPMDLNRGVEINYETQKASEILQEGPLFCPDGITSMVQLWPNPSIQNA